MYLSLVGWRVIDAYLYTLLLLFLFFMIFSCMKCSKEFSANYSCTILVLHYNYRIFFPLRNTVFYLFFCCCYYLCSFIDFFSLQLLGADYLLILLFYLLLAFTGIFAFAHLNDLYTLNFQPDRCKDVDTPIAIYCLQVMFDFWKFIDIG